jgi:cell division control protein 6
MYICGPPGTGKTALMNEIFSEYKECPSRQKADMAFINCMSFENPEEVFDRIAEEFNTNTGSFDSQLEYLFLKRKTISYEPPSKHF